MRIFTFILLLAFAMELFAERQGIERYQSVIDRQMFGKPPPGFDPTKPPSEVSKSDSRPESVLQAEQKIKTAIRFSAINVTPDGSTAVGFTDNSDSKNPIHYYLKVGESRNGWLVKDADPIKATMTIAKDDVEVALTIGGNSAQSDSASGSAAAGSLAGRGILNRRQGPSAAQPGISAGTLRGRRLLREQQRQADEAEAAARRAEENARQEEARRREEEERAQRAAEREEQRAQLLQIQEELRKTRELRAAREAEQSADASGQAEEPAE